MALYDSPASKSYQVLTHPSAGRLYAKNGYGQVGNAIAPSHSISATRFTPSAIYNKNVPTGRLSGLRDTQLREAGYGKRYPYPPGLGRVRAYKPGLRAAGWPTLNRTPLRDAYINDNPPPGTLGVRGLSDDTSMMSIDTSSVIVPPDGPSI